MLTTKRLVLRDMRAEDASYLAAYQSNPAYLQHYDETANAVEIVQVAMDWALECPRANYQFAVALRSSDSVVGCAGLRQHGYRKGEAELGIEIDPRRWREGLAGEALAALIEFGASTLSLSCYWAVTTSSNESALALIEKFGFTFQARDRNSVRYLRRNERK